MDIIARDQIAAHLHMACEDSPRVYLDHTIVGIASSVEVVRLIGMVIEQLGPVYDPNCNGDACARRNPIWHSRHSADGQWCYYLFGDSHSGKLVVEFTFRDSGDVLWFKLLAQGPEFC